MRPLLLSLLTMSMAHSASLHGYVRDEAGMPVPGAAVQISRLPSNAAQTFKADASGQYKIPTIVEGAYKIWTNDAAGAVTTTLGSNEDKRLDLTFKPSTDSIPFTDEPNFVVAGVTDNTSMGSHGSDVTQRSAEKLAKATSALKPGTNPTAEAQEASGNPLAAAHEYQRVAEQNPSEDNLFAWGSELLNHGAAQPAQEVFDKGCRLYPQSSRLLLGSAVALYSQARYSEAAAAFFRAADLNPFDPLPYQFLAKVQAPEIAADPGYAARMARFAALHPDSAEANYDYALTLRDPAQTQELLEKAIELDPKRGEAYLHLGILYAQQGQTTAAIEAFQNAVAAEPDLQQAHYRLAAAYRKAGNLDAAERETELFRRLSVSDAQEREKERAQLQRFVIALKHPAANR